MRKLSILFLLFLPFISYSQTENLVIQNMCEEFKKTSHLTDSTRVENIYSKYLYPYLEEINSNKNIDSIGTSLYIRLQKECQDFRLFLIERTKSEHWQLLNKMPKSEFTKNQKKEFNKISKFYYYEGETNEITNVNIKNNFWIDSFTNSTYSKNIFKWINKNKFTLKHLESNNLGRKAFSRKGEKYFYQIINKKDNYYTIAAQIPNQTEILLFKLYIKQ